MHVCNSRSIDLAKIKEKAFAVNPFPQLKSTLETGLLSARLVVSPVQARTVEVLAVADA